MITHQSVRSELKNSTYTELRLLEEVQNTPDISQRRLAVRLGVALGVANALIRSLVNKGYVRSSQMGWKRWAYMVTPSGIRRKVQLTVDYVEGFLEHYHRVKTMLADELADVSAYSDKAVAVCGTTALSELVYLALHDMNISRVDFLECNPTRTSFLGRPVRTPEHLDETRYAKIIVAGCESDGSMVRALIRAGIAERRIVSIFDPSSSGVKRR